MYPALSNRGQTRQDGAGPEVGVMQLKVREAASLMDVSEKTIYRWIRRNNLPASRINDQYRFNRAELLEWATAHRINVSADIFGEPESGKTPIPGLADALKAGGIHYRIGGTDKDSVLKSAVDVMPLPEEVDKAFLLRVMVARESLGSTAIGDGIAIPHVRNPIVLHVPRPMIALCFLDQAIEYGALDGKPIHTIFAIVSPTISAHLNLLSKLTFALRQTPFADVIARQAAREEIIQSAALIDSRAAGHGVGVTAEEGAQL
jgi:PTS system nitrogen regulatory IIA component